MPTVTLTSSSSPWTRRRCSSSGGPGCAWSAGWSCSPSRRRRRRRRAAGRRTASAPTPRSPRAAQCPAADPAGRREQRSHIAARRVLLAVLCWAAQISTRSSDKHVQLRATGGEQTALQSTIKLLFSSVISINKDLNCSKDKLNKNDDQKLILGYQPGSS